MDDVGGVGEEMLGQGECGQEDGREGGGVGGVLHADQLVFKIIVVLGEKYSVCLLLYCFNLHGKFVWKLGEYSWRDE